MMRRTPPWTVAIVTAATLVALQLGGDSVVSALRYDRALLADGEWWRCLTGSLVHAGWPHLAVNLAGLGLAALVLDGVLTGWRWVFSFAIGALVVTLGLWLWSPDVDWYLGASGALHGLFVAGAMMPAMRREPTGMLVMALVTAKLAWEQFAGPLPGSETTAGVPVIVDAHLYGAIGGLSAAPLATMTGYLSRSFIVEKNRHG